MLPYVILYFVPYFFPSQSTQTHTCGSTLALKSAQSCFLSLANYILLSLMSKQFWERHLYGCYLKNKSFPLTCLICWCVFYCCPFPPSLSFLPFVKWWRNTECWHWSSHIFYLQGFPIKTCSSDEQWPTWNNTFPPFLRLDPHPRNGINFLYPERFHDYRTLSLCSNIML